MTVLGLACAAFALGALAAGVAAPDEDDRGLCFSLALAALGIGTFCAFAHGLLA